MKVQKKKGPKMKSGYTEDPVEEAFSNEKLRSTLQSVRMLPRQKYDAPQTANQMIGWFAHTAREGKDRWYQGSKSNKITRWADNYEVLYKINPYKVKR